MARWPTCNRTEEYERSTTSCQQISLRWFADRALSRGRSSMEGHDIPSLRSYRLRHFCPHSRSHLVFPHLAARDPLS